MYTTNFHSRNLITSTANVSVWAVELSGQNNESINLLDLDFYQSLIDQLTQSTPIIFATLNRAIQPNGLWTVGLRRAGKAFDVGMIGVRLGKCSNLGFKSGGGHPYAAGAQSTNVDLSTHAVCAKIANICERTVAENLSKAIYPELENEAGKSDAEPKANAAESLS